MLHELEKVFEWFVLGPYLGVPEHELETIKLDHLNNNKECKQKMVSTWMKRGDASWSALVRALWAIGRCALAKKIAYKFGECSHDFFHCALCFLEAFYPVCMS